jgi:hypothetical protein
MKPLTTEQIGNTEWNIVFTVSGSTYYFNTSTNEVSWVLPESLNTKKKLEGMFPSEIYSNIISALTWSCRRKK